MIVKPYFLVCCFAIISTIVSAQIDTAAISAKLKQVNSQLGKNFVFVLYKDGKIAYKKESEDFTLRTQNPIYASSQWLTTALVMTFVQEGKLSLDDKVSDYLPIFSKYYKSYITIRHCLTHYTGIENDGVGKLFSKGKFSTLEEEVNEFASKRDIITNAGTEFQYSNIGLNIAARVLEAMTKRTFDRLLQERLTRPLAMRATNFNNDNYNAALNPSGGAKSTAADMTNFLAMLLNKGTFNGKQVLTEESVALMHQLHVTSIPAKHVPKSAEGWSYGFGEWILDANAKGEATVVAVPSLYGTYPLIDLCGGYAFFIFTKNLGNEPPRSLYAGIKEVVDNAIGGNGCN